MTEIGWESLKPEEREAVIRFGQGGRSYHEMKPILRRLEFGMEADFLRGHRTAIDRARAEMEQYRRSLRERAREAREARCTRLPSSS